MSETPIYESFTTKPSLYFCCCCCFICARARVSFMNIFFKSWLDFPYIIFVSARNIDVPHAATSLSLSLSYMMNSLDVAFAVRNLRDFSSCFLFWFVKRIGSSFPTLQEGEKNYFQNQCSTALRVLIRFYLMQLISHRAKIFTRMRLYCLAIAAGFELEVSLHTNNAGMDEIATSKKNKAVTLLLFIICLLYFVSFRKSNQCNDARLSNKRR